MLDLHIEQWPIERLVPYEHNPRKSDHVVSKMVETIRTFGFRIPVLAKSDGELIDGHLRVKAEDVTLELASRAAVLAMGLRSAFRLHAPDLVSLVGGDTNKTHIMLEHFEKNLDAALHEYSRPIDFKVEYVPDNDDTNSNNALTCEHSEDSEAD